VNRRRKNGDNWEDEPSFFDIVLWGRSGEALNQYLLKGKAIGVEGELRQDRWQQDGQNRSKVEVVANNIQLLGSPGGGSGGGYSGGSSQGGAYGGGSAAGGQAAESGASGGPAQVKDDGFADDIPF